MVATSVRPANEPQNLPFKILEDCCKFKTALSLPVIPGKTQPTETKTRSRPESVEPLGDQTPNYDPYAECQAGRQWIPFYSLWYDPDGD